MKIKKIITKWFLLMITGLILIPGTVFAQPADELGEFTPDIDELLYKFQTEFEKAEDVVPTTTDYIASLPSDEPGLIIGQITFYLLVVANILAFISFLASGVYMLMSQGNEEDLSKAKRMLLYTIIAMIICATALALVTGITRFQFFNF